MLVVHLDGVGPPVAPTRHHQAVEAVQVSGGNTRELTNDQATRLSSERNEESDPLTCPRPRRPRGSSGGARLAAAAPPARAGRAATRAARPPAWTALGDR